ncbi:MAG: putative endonuclease [Phycisphaerales bacterium]
MPGFLARLTRREAAHLRVGRLGEKAAARHLRQRRYTVLERNTRTARGELDLICLAPDRQTVVIVEVKARALRPGASEDGFRPELHITQAKRAKLRSLAQSVRQARGWLDRPVRIDVIAVDLDRRNKPTVRHYENAV